MRINKKQKVTIFFGLAIIFAALILWLADGTYVFTQTKVLIERKDPLFGNVYKEWQDKFIWGLDLTLVVSAISVVISAVLIRIFREKQKVVK